MPAPPSVPMSVPLSWQQQTLAGLTALALRHGADRVQAVGSVAAGTVDEWSDLDALVVVPDGRLPDFWPDRGWLVPLGPVAAAQTALQADGAAIRLLLADGRKVDVLLAERSAADARLARLADTTPVVGQESIDAAADRLLFDAATVVTRAARGERLIATHLALGLLERCLEAAMVRRDLGTGSCVHRHATAYDDLADLLPALPAAPGPEDLLDLVGAALDCFERITGTPLHRAAVDALIGKARRALG